MAWFNTSWPFRKKLTVTAAKVVGSGTLTGVPACFLPGSDADILASARPDGADLVFTSSDGETQLPHELIPSKQFISRDAVWSWFSTPSAVYYNGTEERLYVGVACFINSGSSRQKVLQYDYATGTITETHIGSVDQPDDHNNPTILVRDSDERIMVFYSKWHSFDDLAFRVSTNPEDATSFGSETVLDPDAASGYGYPSPVEIVGEGRIYLFYRVTTGQNYRYIYSEDDGATWSASVGMFSGTGFGANPYRVLTSNGTRIDFLISSDDGNAPAAGPMKIAHCYYDGADSTWKNSVGTSMGSPPFDWSDFTTIYDGAGVDPTWVSDITYDSNGHPHVLFYVYPGEVDTNQDLWEGEFNGTTWTTRKVCDEGIGPVPARPIYPGVARLDPADDTIAWIAKEVSSVYEIQKWKKTADTWAKMSGPDGDVTKTSFKNHFRPLIAKDCPEGKPGRLLYLSPYDYSDVITYLSGIATYPALGSNFAIAYFKADLNGSADNEFYVYYGNPLPSADQQDRASLWSDYLRVWHTEERYGASQSWIEDASGNTTPQGLAATGTSYRSVGFTGPTNVGNAISFNGSQDIGVGSPNLASFTGITVNCWGRSTLAAVHALISTGFSTSAADIALWLDNTPGLQVHNVISDNSYKFGAPLSGITPTANTWQWFSLLWSAAGGLQGRMNKTETTVASSTGVSLDNGATGSMTLGRTPTGSNALSGALAEVRITDSVYHSKDFTDTQWDNWDQGNGFFTIGAEEGFGGGQLISGGLINTGLVSGGLIA